MMVEASLHDGINWQENFLGKDVIHTVLGIQTKIRDDYMRKESKWFRWRTVDDVGMDGKPIHAFSEWLIRDPKLFTRINHLYMSWKQLHDLKTLHNYPKKEHHPPLMLRGFVRR
jgi:hypothetical protein